MSSRTIGIVGAGTFLSPYHAKSNYLLIDDETRLALAVDCGSGYERALREYDFPMEYIEGVSISHLHEDHFGGLGGIGRFFHFILPPSDKNWRKPHLYVPKPIAQDLTTYLGMVLRPHDPTAFFHMHRLAGSGKKIWKGLELSYYPVLHENGPAGELVLAYALHVRCVGSGKAVLFTSDVVRPLPFELYRMADVVIHDCSLTENPVHISYERLLRLPNTIRSRIWLTHYADGPNDDLPDAVADGFLGFVVQGQTIPFPR